MSYDKKQGYTNENAKYSIFLQIYRKQLDTYIIVQVLLFENVVRNKWN